MRNLGAGLLLLLLAAGVLVSARFSVRAQEREPNDPRPKPGLRLERIAQGGGPAEPAVVSVQDALLRPFSFSFTAPTSLADVCEHLRQRLKAPVVLDQAALDRLELKPEDAVKLQLEGVRLKVGLKLLLDQVGMTFQVIPEDNLLILTDVQGSSDPIDRVLTEIKALHHDVHDLQDAVDEINAALAPDEAGGARMRKPTIIEELPAEPKPREKKDQPLREGTDRPRTRPGT